MCLPSPSASSNHPQVTEKNILEALRSFYPGSAGGLDGLRPQILKDLTCAALGQAAERLVSSLQKLTDLMLSGGVPVSVSPFLYGATLTALHKKEGGIRPIAIGMTWRRLASKIVVSAITPAVAAIVSPHQLGVGVKGGAEVGAHAGRRYFNHTHASPKIFLKLDFRNAFNEIRRDAMLNAVLEFIPSFYHYVSSCYTHPSFLYFGQDIILSQRGVQQGDPLGPALFALTIKPIIEEIKTELNIWYLDDGAVADSVDEILNTISTVREKSNNLGLHLNENKCEAHILGSSREEETDIVSRLRQIAPSIRIAKDADSTLLGAPLSDAANEAVLTLKTHAFSIMSRRLSLISSHAAFFLLRASLSFPRLIYFLRCAPAWHCQGSLQRYDVALKEAVENILNCALQESSWKQSALPVKDGGIGIRHAEDIAIPCFLASAHSVQHLVDILLPPLLREDPAVKEGLSLWSSSDQIDLPALQDRGRQDAWEKPQVQNTIHRLYDSAPTKHDKARLLAIQQPDSGSWLFAIPSPQLGTLLSDDTFRVCCSLRLGCEICQPHTCHCGELVDSRGYHGLSCKFSSGRRSRHDQANDVISRALRAAEVPNTREPIGCSRSDGKKPDGLTLIPWSQGRSVIWDFTCTDTLAPTYISDSEHSPGSAAGKAERRKMAKYAALSGRFSFVPIAIETFGVWGAQGRRFFSELASRLTRLTGDARIPGYLKQRMSLAVQRGNVASILGTLPPGRSLDEIFFL